MAQTKTIVLFVAGFALFGLLVCGGGGAYWYFTQYRVVSAPDVGPLAGQALVLPADSAVLAGLDVKGFLGSAAYKKITAGEVVDADKTLTPEDAERKKKELKEGIEKGLKEGEDKTGIRFDRDLDRVVLAVSNVAAPTPDGAIIAVGRFDRAKVTSALEASAKAEGASVTSKTVEGMAVQVFTEHGKPGVELAFLDDSTLVAGTPGAVEAVVTSRAKGVRPLGTNAGLLGLVKGLDPSSGYWAVIDQPLIARGQKEAGAGAPPVPLPQNLTLAGKFDGGMELTGQMADAAAATGAEQMLAQGLEMARGMAEQSPEAQKVAGAKALLDGIKVKAEGKVVKISLSGAGGGSAALGGVLAALALPTLMKPQGMAGGVASGAIQTPPSPPEATAPESLAPAEAPVEAPPAAPVATPRPRAAPTRTPPVRTPAPSRPSVAPPTTEAPAPPPTAPAQPLRVGGAIAEPKKIKNVSPSYPAAAKNARVQGIVIMECTITPEGRVSDVRVLRSIPMLDAAAVEAVRQWVYEPTLMNGVPVTVVMTVTVSFKMR